MKKYQRKSTARLAAATSLLLGSAMLAAPPAGFVDASTFGFSKTDATAALQAAINTGQNVYVPNMGTDWNVRPITLTKSNQQIYFENGVVVAAKAGAFQGDDQLFSAPDCVNVRMIGYGATLKMRKSDYTQAPYTQSEHRHGISLGTVKNFEILGLTIKDTGGDGIYVGASNGLYSENVLIKDVTLDNNYRQGISVISVKDLAIDNTIIRTTGGTSPQAGIDFEPNFANQRLQNINVRNSIINSNGSWGMLFATDNLDGTSVPVTGTVENVSIYSNGYDGIGLNKPLPSLVLKDSLVVNNAGRGLRGTAATATLTLSGTPQNSIDYSVLTGNTQGAISGWVKLGPGTSTSTAPVFYSTDPSSPYYLYLDTTTAASIRQGASDGSFIGARPVFSNVGQTWAVNASGNWNLASNWVGNVIPTSVGQRANFGGSITAPRTIYTDTGVTVGALKFDSANGYQLTGQGSLSLDVFSGTVLIDVLQGTHKINLPVFVNDSTIATIAAGATLKISDPMTLMNGATFVKAGTGTLSIEAPVFTVYTSTLASAAGVMDVGTDLGNNTTLAVAGGTTTLKTSQHLARLNVSGGAVNLTPGAGVVVSTQSLTINQPGLVDLHDGKMIVDYTGDAPMGDIRSMIDLGLLTSSLTNDRYAIGYGEASDLFTDANGTFAGEGIDASSILIAYTVRGDVTLDGTTDSTDFNMLSGHYGITSNARWTQGDLNSDSKINTLDFNLLAGNFGSTLPATSPTIGATVPEPGTVFTGTIVTLAMLARRRTRLPLKSAHVSGVSPFSLLFSLEEMP